MRAISRESTAPATRYTIRAMPQSTRISRLGCPVKVISPVNAPAKKFAPSWMPFDDRVGGVGVDEHQHDREADQQRDQHGDRHHQPRQAQHRRPERAGRGGAGVPRATANSAPARPRRVLVRLRRAVGPAAAAAPPAPAGARSCGTAPVVVRPAGAVAVVVPPAPSSMGASVRSLRRSSLILHTPSFHPADGPYQGVRRCGYPGGMGAKPVVSRLTRLAQCGPAPAEVPPAAGPRVPDEAQLGCLTIRMYGRGDSHPSG